MENPHALHAADACYCFDTCTVDAIRNLLLQYVPATVTAATPLWRAYYQAVYRIRSSLLLPYSTARNNYWYHNGAAWRAAHPSVEWPMASCAWSGGALTTPNVNHIGLTGRRNISVAAGWVRCQPAACERWRAEAASSPRRQHESAAPEHAFLMPGGDGGRSSGGVVVYGAAFATFAADGAFVEVMRMRTADVVGTAGFEGSHGNGCWLFQAAGSGIFVSVGKSWRAASERSILGANTSFAHAYASFRRSSPKKSPWTSAHVNKEAYPAQAHAMGYDSIQMGAKVFKPGYPHAQIILTSEPCMASPKPIKGCLPKAIATRAGEGASLPCACVDGPSMPMLTCASA